MIPKVSDEEQKLGEQKLRDAAERGDIGEVARLIESGVSVKPNCVVSSDSTLYIRPVGWSAKQ